MTYTYTPTGVCSSKIDLELENGVIRSVVFTGGCNGNLQGISRLVTGMTSCPDQLSKALTAALKESGQ